MDLAGVPGFTNRINISDSDSDSDSDVSTCLYKLCQINIILILNSMSAILYNRCAYIHGTIGVIIQCAYIHGTIGVISVGTPCHT